MKNSIISTLIFASSLIFIFSCTHQDNNLEAKQSSIDSLTRQVTLFSSTQQKEEMNKKLVADFYQELFGDKNVDAIDKYIGDVYIQHNPSLPDGKKALKEGATQWFKGAPKEKVDIQHLGADGDLVYIHTKGKNGTITVSVIDIFRIEDGLIIEHWDVLQDVPEKSANSHPMF